MTSRGDPSVAVGAGQPRPSRHELLRGLPRIDDLLAAPRALELAQRHDRGLVRDALRDALDALRRDFSARETFTEDDRSAIAPAAVIAAAERVLDQKTTVGMCRVVNATGVVMHTGLGRAPLAPAAQEAVLEAIRGYCLLEVDRASGERGVRETYVAALLCELLGAQAVTVVNNNAAATLIALAAVARGKEVVCSRGQLVEIGGSFRIPEVMAEGGATLVEVGATNKTHLADYERAIGEHTGALLRVHTSNYRIVGFAEDVPLADLVALGRRRNVPVIDDLGSGALVDLAPYGLPGEPVVREVLRAGVDLVCFSGDKLLGGPQAGILAGRADLVARCRRHPLFRAMRPDKMALAALEATLILYRSPDSLALGHPTFRLLTQAASEIEPRARALAHRLEHSCPGLVATPEPGLSQPGSGALPATTIPSWVVRTTHPRLRPKDLADSLRAHAPPIFTRVQDDAVVLDCRTLLDGDEDDLARAFAALR